MSVNFFAPEYQHLRYSSRGLECILRENHFDFDVFLPSLGRNLQRELVWEKEAVKRGLDRYEYHRKLIESIFAYNDFGKIVLYKKCIDVEPYIIYQVIDGKQRINALLDFVNGKFGIFREGVEYFYNDLPPRIRGKFKNTVFNCCEIDSQWKELTDDELIDLFISINDTGVPQTDEYLKELKAKRK